MKRFLTYICLIIVGFFIVQQNTFSSTQNPWNIDASSKEYLCGVDSGFCDLIDLIERQAPAEEVLAVYTPLQSLWFKDETAKGIAITFNEDGSVKYRFSPCGNLGGTVGTYITEPKKTNKSNPNDCSTRIYDWNKDRSDCDASPFGWNGTSHPCQQKRIYTPVYEPCYTEVPCVDNTPDGVDDCENVAPTPKPGCDGSCDPADKPADETHNGEAYVALGRASTCEAFADNYDSCSISVPIRSRGIYGGKKVINLGGDVSVTGGGPVYYTFGGGSYNTTSLEIGDIKSKQPESKSYNLQLNLPFTINGSFNFKEPFKAVLEASSKDKDGNLTWNYRPTLGTNIKYRLRAEQVSGAALTLAGLNGYKFEIDDIKVSDIVELVLNNVNKKVPTFTLKDGSEFNATINTHKNSTKLVTLGILTKGTISYDLAGRHASYSLESGINGGEFLGLLILGNKQLTGKQAVTNQTENFSDLSKIDSRTIIRKNAYSNIKSLSKGKVVNGVYYNEGNIKISKIATDLGTLGLSKLETIVIKDGNLIIDKNLTNKDLKINDKFGIIVLKDGYDVKKDYDNKGNVYVTQNVKEINAIIYADGGFISADEDGNPYLVDDSDRTSNLQNQLIMKGTLFTRNTVGGSILRGGNYILPGGIKLTEISSNFDNAMLYDLNYVRRGKENCRLKPRPNPDPGLVIAPDVCIYDKSSFIIKYDSVVQSNPPKLFAK